METILYILAAWYFIQLEKALRKYFVIVYHKFRVLNKRRKNRKRTPERIQAEVFNIKMQ